MELDYSELEVEIISKLEKANNIVFATSVNDRVTARMMANVNIGLDIFFGTKGFSEKVEQISHNPLVALVADNLSIEGKALIVGHPDDVPDFTIKYLAKFPQYGTMYPTTSDDVVIKISPTKISMYKYIDGPCSDVLDIENNRAYRIRY